MEKDDFKQVMENYLNVLQISSSSAMIISLLEEMATIFSRSNAPHRPFISRKCESIVIRSTIGRSRLWYVVNESRGYLVAAANASFPFWCWYSLKW